jgi:dihydrofolate reductase
MLTGCLQTKITVTRSSTLALTPLLWAEKPMNKFLTFGEYPYKGKKNYVFTRHPSCQSDNNAKFIATDVKNFVDDLRQVDGKNIWLVGGSL